MAHIRSLLACVQRRYWWGLATFGAIALLALTDRFHPITLSEPASSRSIASPSTQAPPWRYGPETSRFTIVIYADLECPFCQSYTPVLRQWVDNHPETNLLWHHLPLSIHEPAASKETRWIECVGQVHGHAHFWEAVTWMYQHTLSDGKGLPADTEYPNDPGVRACLKSDRPDTQIKHQLQEARREGFEATPMLRIIDNESKRSMILAGPVAGDSLLSALDLLSTPRPPPAASQILSADVVSDMPR